MGSGWNYFRQSQAAGAYPALNKILKLWGRNKPDRHRRRPRDRGGSVRHITAAAGDIQDGHIEGTVWVYVVDEDLQKTHDGDGRLASHQSSRSVKNRQGNNRIAAGNCGADAQRIGRAAEDSVRKDGEIQRILTTGR